MVNVGRLRRFLKAITNLRKEANCHEERSTSECGWVLASSLVRLFALFGWADVTSSGLQLQKFSAWLLRDFILCGINWKYFFFFLLLLLGLIVDCWFVVSLSMNKHKGKMDRIQEFYQAASKTEQVYEKFLWGVLRGKFLGWYDDGSERVASQPCFFFFFGVIAPS